MPAPYNFLTFKVEDVLTAFFRSIDDLSPAVNVYSQADAIAPGAKLVEPYVGVICQESTPIKGVDVDAIAGISNRTVRAKVIVRTHAAPLADGTSGRDFHSRTVGRVMDCLYRSDIIDAMNSIGTPNIVVSRLDTPDTSTAVIDRSYQTLISFGVDCYPQADG